MSRRFMIAVSGGTPGADSNDYVLFNSITAFGLYAFRSIGMNRLQFELNNSHNGTLALQRSNDNGTNWRTVDTRSVTAPAAGTTNGPFDYIVDGYLDVRLVWTNAGTAQNPWEPTLTGIEGTREKAS